MIVTCPECSTKFNLDPGRITGDTARVRCSKCKYVFEITEQGRVLPAIPKAEPAASGPKAAKAAKAAPAVRKPVVSSIMAKRILVVVLLALVVGGAAVGFWVTNPFGKNAESPAQPVDADPGNKHLALINVEGQFAESATLGKVFVVHGLVRNDYNHSVRFIRIQGLLHNGPEEPPLKSVVAYAGNPLSEEEIRLLSEDELKLVLDNKDGKSDLDAHVPPGETVPFSLLFSDLPPEMKEYTVKVLDSQPDSE